MRFRKNRGWLYHYVPHCIICTTSTQITYKSSISAENPEIPVKMAILGKPTHAAKTFFPLYKSRRTPQPQTQLVQLVATYNSWPPPSHVKTDTATARSRTPHNSWPETPHEDAAARRTTRGRSIKEEEIFSFYRDIGPKRPKTGHFHGFS